MTLRPVVVLGDANVDLVIRLPDRERDGPLAQTTLPEMCGGGTGANTAVALARLGVPVVFAGMIGDDLYGRDIQADLRAEGVDLSGLRVRADVATPSVIAIVLPDGDRVVVIWPPTGGAHTHLRPEDLDAEQITRAAWLHTTGMCLDQRPVAGAALRGMEIAQEAGVPVSLDLNLRLELGAGGWRPGQRPAIEQAVARADVVLGSGQEEIVPLAGASSIEAAARALGEGQRTIIARLGDGGAFVAWPGGEAHVPGFEVAVVDTLGAGDAFNGGYIAARLAGLGEVDAVRWGNAVAALSITRSGARGTPRRAEVEAFLAQVRV